MHYYLKKQIAATETALRAVLSIDEGTKVLLIHDSGTENLCYSFFTPALKKIGAELSIYKITQKRPMVAVPKDLLLQVNDGHEVAINLFTDYTPEIPVRIKLIGAEVQNNLRVGHGPGITRDMFGQRKNNFKKGAMLDDYNRMRTDAESLMQKLEGTHDMYITSPSGTELYLTMKKGQEFETDTIVKNGNMGNLPCGEVWSAITYKDHSLGKLVGDGVVVADICCGMKNGRINPRKPVIIKTEEGILKGLETKDELVYSRILDFLNVEEDLLESKELLDRLNEADGSKRTFRRPCELQEQGIGLNKKARITDKLLETEKLGGTAHNAWGLLHGAALSESKYYGHINKEIDDGTHGDFLYSKPTIAIRKVDGDIPVFIAKESDLGDWETIMRNGRFVKNRKGVSA
jgi:hypothetical protein